MIFNRFRKPPPDFDDTHTGVGGLVRLMDGPGVLHALAGFVKLRLLRMMEYTDPRRRRCDDKCVSWAHMQSSEILEYKRRKRTCMPSFDYSQKLMINDSYCMFMPSWSAYSCI